MLVSGLDELVSGVVGRPNELDAQQLLAVMLDGFAGFA